MGVTRRDRERRKQPHGRRRGQFTGVTRRALFVFESAGAAGFQFRDAGAGIEVLGPPGVDLATCPTIATVREHANEIQRIVRWLDREADAGRVWMPRASHGTRQ